jgi:N-acetylneuraminic acid mutarotase
MIFNMGGLALAGLIFASINLMEVKGQLSGKNPCHPYSVKSNSSSCEVMTLPIGFCGACPFGTFDNAGKYQDCTRVSQLEDNANTWPTCKASLERYVELNPCDVVRASALNKYLTKTGSAKETARQQLDFFLYAFCEAGCDCIPQTGADPNKPSVSIERGNCQAHPYYDICKQSPNIKLVRLEGTSNPNPSTLQKVCPKITDWFNAPGSDDWPTLESTYVEPTVVKPFLERLVEATELTTDMAVWSQCYSLETSQNRIEDIPSLPPSSPTTSVNGTCWVDSSTNRAMQLKAPDLGINDCISFCRNHQHKYPFAGVQFGKECFCGVTYQKYGSAPASDCNYTCAVGGGICGGLNRMNVYSTVLPTLPPTMLPTPQPILPPTPQPIRPLTPQPTLLPTLLPTRMPASSPTTSVNGTCWVDSSKNRTMQLRAPNLGIKDCIGFCRNHQNKYPFAAVQFGKECFCGVTYQKHGSAPASDCNYTCAVGGGICGGFNRMNVYSTSDVAPSPPTFPPGPLPTPQPISVPTLQPASLPTPQPAPRPTALPTKMPSGSPPTFVNGTCWVDSSKDRAMQLKAPDLGINDCIGFCRNHQKKYPFAAVQFGKECFCGFTYHKYGPAPASDCNSTCAVGGGICGGFNRMNVYSTVLPSLPPTMLPTPQPILPPTPFPTRQPTPLPLPLPTTPPTLRPAPLPTPLPTNVPAGSPSPSVYGECWKDSSKDRAMQLKAPNLGINDCIGYCLNHQNKYPFAAVQFGKECFCGFTYHKYGPAPASDCNYTCEVGGGVCGGIDRMNVYSTTYAAPSPPTPPTPQPSVISPGPSWINLNESENYVPRHECSFVQAGNKFYMFGGREQAYRMDIYNYASNTWTRGVETPDKVELNHFQAVEYQGLIWVIGAFQTNSFPKEVPATNIYVYDSARNKWNIGMSIPSSRQRGGAGLVVYDGKFYVVGGNTNGHDGGFVNWADEYDPVSNEWTPLQDAPNARDHFSAVVVGNQIYCIGGRQTDSSGTYFDKVVSAVDRYTIGASWTTIGGASLPDPRAGAATAYFDGKILIAGGESVAQSNAYSAVDAFDPVTHSFQRLRSMNYRRHGTQAIVSGGGFFVAGGSPVRGGGNQRNMEVYGTNTPIGSASSIGVLSGPEIVVSIEASSSTDISIRHTEGNTGVFVNNVALTGADASLFTLDITDSLRANDPSLNDFLIPVGGTRSVTVHCLSHKESVDAFLTLVYASSEVLSVPLSSQPTFSRREMQSTNKSTSLMLRASAGSPHNV